MYWYSDEEGVRTFNSPNKLKLGGRMSTCHCARVSSSWVQYKVDNGFAYSEIGAGGS